jgi:AcrR family transcriptional regulator
LNALSTPDAAGATRVAAGAPPAAEKPLRSDAQRNRDALLATARAAFTTDGDTVPLEKIAKDAGVGIGTLYRHFPTRESLVEAVYSAELDAVVGDVDVVLRDLPPDKALREWMNRYGRFMATKRGMLGTLRAGWASGNIATPTTRTRVNAAIGTILAAGAADGSLRSDVTADDVTAMLLGVFLSSAGSDGAEQADRLLDLLVDAVLPKA